MMLLARAPCCGLVRRRFASLVLAPAHCTAGGVTRSFASQAATVLTEHINKLTPRRREALASRRSEIAEVHAEASALGASSVVAELDFKQLCALCHLLSAGGYLPSQDLLEGAAAQLRQLVAASSSNLATDDADAAAELALAVCEAGGEKELGANLVEALCAAGLASSSGSEGLSGTGAAHLALAAAAAGQADASLLDALLMRCSTREVDLDLAVLGDVRLAAILAGPDVVSALDVRAAGFFRTLCNDILLDDPRGVPALGEDEAQDALTSFELEVSEALHACETPHSRGVLLAGTFFPLMSHGRNCVVCAEHSAAFATYANMTDQRTAWQRWKYKAAISAGFKVFAVPEADWRALVGKEERAAFMRKVLQNPLDAESL